MSYFNKIISLVLVFCFSSTSFAFNVGDEESKAIESYEFVNEAREDFSAKGFKLTKNISIESVLINIAVGAVLGMASMLFVDNVYNLITKKDLPSPFYTGAALGVISMGALIVFSILSPEQELADGTIGPSFLVSKEKLQEFFDLDPEVAIGLIKSSPVLQKAFNNLRVIYPEQDNLDECIGLDKNVYIDILNESLFESHNNFSKDSTNLKEDATSLNMEEIQIYYDLINSRCHEEQDGGTHFLGASAFDEFNNELGKSIEDNQMRLDVLKGKLKASDAVRE